MMRGILMAMIASAALSACANSNDTAAPSLAGTSWTAVSIDGVAVTPPGRVTLRFDEGRIGGKGGCNAYGGDARIAGAKISFGPIVSTKMACLEDGLMQLEGRYFNALQRVTDFARPADDRLTFSGPNVRIEFVRAPATR